MQMEHAWGMSAHLFCFPVHDVKESALGGQHNLLTPAIVTQVLVCILTGSKLRALYKFITHIFQTF